MKYIASRPARLYCNTCEELYNLPQGGAIKLYKVGWLVGAGLDLVACGS